MSPTSALSLALILVPLTPVPVAAQGAAAHDEAVQGHNVAVMKKALAD